MCIFLESSGLPSQVFNLGAQQDSSRTSPVESSNHNRPSIETSTVAQSLDRSELDFLALLSGSRVDNRPFRFENETEENGFGARHGSTSGNRSAYIYLNIIS